MLSRIFCPLSILSIRIRPLPNSPLKAQSPTSEARFPVPYHLSSPQHLAPAPMPGQSSREIAEPEAETTIERFCRLQIRQTNHSSKQRLVEAF